MRLARLAKILFLTVLMLSLLLIAGCAFKEKETAAQKKSLNATHFEKYLNVGWAPSGKNIYTVELYINTKKSYDCRLYSQKPDMSDKILLERGAKLINDIVVSPSGKYMLFSRGGQLISFGEWDTGYLEVMDIKTRKVVSRIPERSLAYGWKDEKTIWYSTTSEGTSVINTAGVGSSVGSELVKGDGLTWSNDGRYLIYTVRGSSAAGGSLFALDTKTNISSNLVESSGGSFLTGVMDGNNLYYVYERDGLSFINVSVLDISRKTRRGLWSLDRPPVAIDETHVNAGNIVSIDKLFLDQSKKSLIFNLDERETQSLVYRLSAVNEGVASREALLRSGSLQGKNPFDYCAANNSITWIDKYKAIKTKRLD